ncbi:MAG: ABC transporter ATP-binding protein [Proteobacteria bacterium]|nr:ABC transporter ATP-binding protein [Pseudomonadota bacterium]
MQHVLNVQDLVTKFRTDDGFVTALQGVSLTIAKGRTLGVVGESGCGKSVTSLSIMGLLPRGVGHIASGTIHFEGQDLTKLAESDMRKIRGNRIAMIFQEPMTALERRLDEYPHQMSGGMKQRVMIAMALACEPALMIADEPTTALDVTIQAQILRLMQDLQKESGTAILFITHNLGVIAEMADDVVVMYAGQVIERTDVLTLFDHAAHPYTQGLLKSIPKPSQSKSAPLPVIPGVVPSLKGMPPGCRFQDRCSLREKICGEVIPNLLPLNSGHEVACHVVHRKLAGQGGHA